MKKPGAWACDCATPVTSTGQQIFSRMYPTEVDGEGICKKCGYYAVWMDSEVLAARKQRGKYFKELNYKKRGEKCRTG